MRKRKSILKLMTVIFLLMFLGNIAVMRLFFGINVFGDMPSSVANPSERDKFSERGNSLNAEGALKREMTPIWEEQDEPGTQEWDEQDEPGSHEWDEQDEPGSHEWDEQKMEATKKEPVSVPTDAESTTSYYVISSDPFTILQNLSLADKLFVLSILPKIGREGMDRLIEMSDDGLAPGEYEEAKRLAENCLKPSDMEKLKEIFAENQGLFAQKTGE